MKHLYIITFLCILVGCREFRITENNENVDKDFNEELNLISVDGGYLINLPDGSLLLIEVASEGDYSIGFDTINNINYSISRNGEYLISNIHNDNQVVIINKDQNLLPDIITSNGKHYQLKEIQTNEVPKE